jgi:hypothetical protein
VVEGAELVALQRNRYWLTPDGLSLDIGAFVATLEYATSRKAHVGGKLAGAFFETILRTAGASAAEAAWSETTSSPASAARSGRVSPASSSAPASTARTPSAPRAWDPDATVDSIARVPPLLTGP